jgi:hypothetical protein
MTRTTQGASSCRYPGCKNEPRPAEEGAGAKYCGLPDPVSGQPHTALTSFRRRQQLATQGAGTAESEDPGPEDALWHPRRRRRTDEQRLQQAEADAEEAHSAMLEVDAQLQEALAAKAAAEQEALERSKDKAAGLRLAREGSILGELLDDVNEAMDWLLDRDT